MGDLASLLIADLDGHHGHLEDLDHIEEQNFGLLADLVPVQRAYRFED
jgi:hypothetical protein